MYFRIKLSSQWRSKRLVREGELSVVSKNNKSSSGDETPEYDVAYVLPVYLFTTEIRNTLPIPEHFSK